MKIETMLERLAKDLKDAAATLGMKLLEQTKGPSQKSFEYLLARSDDIRITADFRLLRIEQFKVQVELWGSIYWPVAHQMFSQCFPRRIPKYRLPKEVVELMNQEYPVATLKNIGMGEVSEYPVVFNVDGASDDSARLQKIMQAIARNTEQTYVRLLDPTELANAVFFPNEVPHAASDLKTAAILAAVGRFEDIKIWRETFLSRQDWLSNGLAKSGELDRYIDCLSKFRRH